VTKEGRRSGRDLTNPGPGSFLEVTKLIEELPKGSRPHPAFHVVALSLPNYGFSEGSKKKGFAIEQYAETCHKLMLKLGYNEYVTQGGNVVPFFSLFQLAKRKKYPAHASPSDCPALTSDSPYLTKTNRRLGHVHHPSHEPNVPDPLPGNTHQYGHGIPPDLDLAPHPRRPTRPDTVQPP
jgi:hypothetical protein